MAGILANRDGGGSNDEQSARGLLDVMVWPFRFNGLNAMFLVGSRLSRSCDCIRYL